MIDKGRFEVLGVGIDAVDYEAAVTRIVEAARAGRALGVSALAVHGVVTASRDASQLARMSRFGLIVPDGQPVRWALKRLYGVTLPDRVYGPQLTLRVCAAAAEAGLSVFMYGSTPEVLGLMKPALRQRFPKLKIAGAMPSAFQQLDRDRQREIARQIIESGADIVLVGLGCPRQEVWVYEHLNLIDCPMLAVGAAFDFISGLMPQAPKWMQNAGLEWLYRLMKEPKRLWRRYVLLNPVFFLNVFLKGRSHALCKELKDDVDIPYMGYG